MLVVTLPSPPFKTTGLTMRSGLQGYLKVEPALWARHYLTVHRVVWTETRAYSWTFLTDKVSPPIFSESKFSRLQLVFYAVGLFPLPRQKLGLGQSLLCVCKHCWHCHISMKPLDQDWSNVLAEV